MKIAHISSTFPPYKGGMGNVVYNQCLELTSLGHEVTVITPKYSKSDDIKDKQYPFRVLRITPLLKYGNAALITNLFSSLEKFDIIQLHYPCIGVQEFLCFQKIIKKNNFLLYYHMDLIGKGIRKLVFDIDNILFRKKILFLAKKILVSSIDYISSSSIKNYYFSNKNKFFELPIGVDLNLFKSLGPQFELRKKHNIKDNEKMILFVSALDKAHYFKGLENLLKAMRYVDNAKLIIIGDGNLKDHYINISKNLEIYDKIIFRGKVSDDELVRYYNLCDLFTLPSTSKSEAFGLVLLEAMACGKPVIASDLPGVRTVVRDGVDGFLVKVGDIKDIANKIDYILSNEDLRKRFGKMGKDKINQYYSWNRVVKRLEEIYNKVFQI